MKYKVIDTKTGLVIHETSDIRKATKIQQSFKVLMYDSNLIILQIKPKLGKVA